MVTGAEAVKGGNAMRRMIRRLVAAITNHPYPTPSTCGICGGPIPCLKH